jgi:hypothetical protein
MSQVLKYGFPTTQRLLCENPVCEEPASMIAHVSASTPDTHAEICGCDAHIKQLITGRRVLKFVALTTPGQRNKERPGAE